MKLWAFNVVLVKGLELVKSDLEIVKQVMEIPSVELSYSSESEILVNLQLVKKRMQELGLGDKKVLKYLIAFNQLSVITNEAKYYYFIISLAQRKVLKLDGDIIWLVEHSSKVLAQEMRKALLDLIE